MRIVSRPTPGTSFRLTASSATNRTVQRARPSGGWLQTMAIIRCLSDASSSSARPVRFLSNSARSRPNSRYRLPIVRIACAANGTARDTLGALSPASSCSNASARKTTRTCWMPPFSICLRSFLSRGFKRNGLGGRAMPKYRSKHFRVELFVKISSGGQRPSADAAR